MSAKETVKVTSACICTKCEGVVSEEVVSLPLATVKKYLEEKRDTFFAYHDSHRKTDYRQLFDSRHSIC